MTDTAGPPTAGIGPEGVVGLAIRLDATSGALRLTGELDQATAPLLRGAVESQLAEGHLRVLVDVAGLRFVDAAGFRVLRATRDRARERGGRVLAVGYDAFFAELARICDAEDVLDPG